jgi:hypothetical protein
VIGVCNLINYEKKVAYIERNVSADLRVKHDVAHRAFPYAVEVDTDEVAVLVYDRAS